MYREQDPKYQGTDRSLQEKLNGQRGGNPPSLDTSPSWEGEFTDLGVIQFFDEELVTDGGYDVDCPYREQSEYGGDRCERFDMDTDENICGGCRVADQILESDDELDLGDLL